jgi:hypothetical protein
MNFTSEDQFQAIDMDLTTYKKLHKKYSNLPLPRDVWDTPEHEEYINAFHNDKECRIWDLTQRIKKAGIDYKKYCCIDMAYRLIEDKNEKTSGEINYDCVITHYKKGKAFGIPIHDGGSSFIKIKYCPWCGEKLI